MVSPRSPKHRGLLELLRLGKSVDSIWGFSKFQDAQACGHDVIVFHVLDEAEVHFPFQGLVELKDPETDEIVPVNADDIGHEYRENVRAFREELKSNFSQSRIDYVPLDTSVPYDKALMEYLISRRNRF